MAVDWSLLDPNMAAKIGGSFQEGQKNALAAQTGQQEQMLNAMKLQQAGQEIASKNALTKAFKESGGDLGKVQKSLMAGGQYKESMEIGKHLAERDKNAVELQKSKLESALKTMDFIDRSLAGVKDQSMLDDARQFIAQNTSQEHLTHIPTVYDPQAIEAIRQQGMSYKDQLQQKNKEYDQVLKGEEIRALGGYRQQQLGLATQAEQRRQRAAETPKLENIPPAHRAAYMENEAALNKIDAAIEKIKANPDALGWSNITPEFITQTTDPEGVDTRAAIAELGAQKRHELSGASVTASESPVLAPFVPKTTDKPEAAIKKAMALKKHYLEANKQYEEEYSQPVYKQPLPTKAKERAEKIGLIDELEALKKEGKITFGAKDGKEMDLEKQPIEDLRKLRDSIKGEKGASVAQETKVIRGKTYYKIDGEWHE